MSHTELHIWIDDTHNPIEKHCEISTIHKFSHGDKGHSGVYQGTRAQQGPYGKRSQQGSLLSCEGAHRMPKKTIMSLIIGSTLMIGNHAMAAPVHGPFDAPLADEVKVLD